MSDQTSQTNEKTPVVDRVGDLVTQVRKLTCADGLMEQTVRHVKESNSLAQYNNKWLRAVIYLFLVALILTTFNVALAWVTLNNVTEVELRLSRAVSLIDDLSKRLVVTEEKLQQVKETTDKAEEVREQQPKIEIIKESNPAKAKESPIKVRITPPVSSMNTKEGGNLGQQAIVEVPLSMQRAVSISATGDAR